MTPPSKLYVPDFTKVRMWSIRELARDTLELAVLTLFGWGIVLWVAI